MLSGFYQTHFNFFLPNIWSKETVYLVNIENSFFSSFFKTLSSSIADFFVSFYGMNGQRLNQECLIENTKICVNGTSNVV